jgi:hypothetical protein
VGNHSYENVFHLHVHFDANQTHFNKKSFAGGLVLKQRQKATQKWPIEQTIIIITRKRRGFIGRYACRRLCQPG